MSQVWVRSLEVVLTLAVGRLCLSFLPAGQPGSLAPHERCATLGASYLLGACATILETHVLRLFGVGQGAWMLVLPWIPLAFVRWATLPGAIVPRHEPRAQTPGWLARGLVWAAALVIVVGTRSLEFPQGEARLQGALCLLALLAVLGHALTCARRVPLGRALVLCAWAAFFVGLLMNTARSDQRFGHAFPALCIGAGAAFSVCWLRRADRRAGALAVVGFAGAALVEHTLPLSVAGLVALCVHTPAPARKALAAVSCAAGLCMFVVTRALSDGSTAITGAENAVWVHTPLAHLAACSILVAIAIAFVGVRKQRRAAERGAGSAAAGLVPDPPLRELSATRSMLLLGVLATSARESWDVASTLRVAFLPLLPLIALIVGLALLPAERRVADA